MLRSNPVPHGRLRAFVILFAALLYLPFVFDVHAQSGDNGSDEVVDPDHAVYGTLSLSGREPGGIAIHPDGGFAVIANEKAGTVSLIALPSGDMMATIAAGRGPREVAIDPGRGLAVVTLAGDDRVQLIDLTAYISVGTVPVGREPHGIAIDPDLGIAVVANNKDDTISIVELDSRTLADTIYVGRDPRMVTVHGDERRAWIVLEKEGVIRVVDLDSRQTVATLPAGKWPSGLAIGASARMAVFANEKANEIVIVDIDSLDVISAIAVGKHPRGVAIDEAAGQAYVVNHQDDAVSVVDLNSLSVIDTLRVGKHPEHVSVNSEHRIAAVTSRGGDGITILTLPDVAPPVITVDYPPDQLLTNQPSLNISGQLDEAAELTVNGVPVSLTDDLRFTHALSLQEGENQVDIVAIDFHGNIGRLDLLIWLDTAPPPAPETGLIVIGSTEDGRISITGREGSVEPYSLVRITNQHTGETDSVIANANGEFQITLDGEVSNTWSIYVIDAAGNAGDSVEITSGSPHADLPPDPATVAPTLALAAVSTLIDAAAFLYNGTNPIQREVAPDTIEPSRIGVLRGRIQSRDGEPLPGVMITIHGHPEFGHTLSRMDGAFDLVVNGGSRLVVRYHKDGFLPVQRGIEVPWQDYAWLPDVVMVPIDDRVTTIDMTADLPMQIARGDSVIDVDGIRQATLLFFQGTQADLVMPDGTIEPLSTLNVRATEYSVGENGPAAMPGELPPASAYTYAVELSVDEAMAAGAVEVRFDRPVYFYVENFLDFPVGGIVPAGWYDRDLAVWIPSDNGRVIEILSVDGDHVELAVDGSGDPADAAGLAALEITEIELHALASLYSPGQRLWRVPVTHFTPWDLNWPYGPPDDALPPDVASPEVDRYAEEPDCVQGSVIECQNSVLGTSIPVTGTSYALHYRSNRVPGRSSAFHLAIPLSGAKIPGSLARIDVRVEVAGRRYTESFPPQENQVYSFLWDGIDGYGRAAQGIQNATVWVGYVYQAVYYQPSDFVRGFGMAGSAPISADPARQEVALWQRSNVMLGLLDARSLGFGGWSLDIQHRYNPTGSALYLGSGGIRSAHGMGNVVDTVAGNGLWGFSGDGGKASLAQLGWPIDVAHGADGSLYISENYNNRVRRVGSDGIITTIAGNGLAGFSGDNGPAMQARLRSPSGIALGADGSIYLADTGNHRIRRVGTDGVIRTVAGTGLAGFSGDGVSATAARVTAPQDVALAPDGSLYIAEGGASHRIRRVGPDGMISTVAGIGVAGFSGDGGPAINARLRAPSGIALGPDGSLYIADRLNFRVRKVSPEGVITTVAGNGVQASGGDGALAVQAQLFPIALAIGTDGSLYISDGGSGAVMGDGGRIRRIGPDNIITTVAGHGAMGFGGDGGLATVARFDSPMGITVGPDNNLYIADYSNDRIRRVGAQLGEPVDNNLLVAARDGSEHYVFDSGWRHSGTIDNGTGVVRYRFEYDAHGYVTRIENVDGDALRIERDDSGRPMAIIAPDGQRTELRLSDNGYLETVSNAADEVHSLSYTAGGLLTGVGDPRGHWFVYEYDTLGRLARSEDPAGGGWELSRSALPDGHETRLVSAEGRMSRFRIEHAAGVGEQRTNVHADGAVESLIIGTDATRTHTTADGTVTVLEEGPDPRFGMGSPVPENIRVTTPSGLTNHASAERTAVLADPDDLLSHTELTETLVRNGRAFTGRYSSWDRTWRHTGPSGRTLISILTPEGRPAQQSLAGLASITYDYDARGRLAVLLWSPGASDERGYSFNYDSAGNLAAVTDPVDRIMAFDYDPAGRVTRQTLPGGRVIDYAYDPNGNLAAIIPPGRDAHLFVYTAVNLESEYSPPDLSGVETTTRYSYNLDRQLIRIDRPDSQALTFDYDAGGRLSVISTQRGQYLYGYKPSTGQIDSVIAPDGSALNFTWDGILPLAEMTSGEVSGSVGYGYDDNFWLTEITVNGDAIAISYNDDGQLTGAGALSLARDAVNGLPAGTTIGSIMTSDDYNSFAEPVAHAVVISGTTVAQFTYERDDLGRIVGKTETVGGAGAAFIYNHDAAGRLTAINRDGITTTWGYDQNGNRTHENGAPIATYDEQDRLQTYGSASYTYTGNGELASKTESGLMTNYVYDGVGNLRQLGLPGDIVIDYLVDGRDRRIGKKINGNLVQGFLYQDQLNPVAEFDGNGNLVSRFVYAEKTNVPSYMIRGGVTYRILSDHLGSPRLVVDISTGEIAQRIDYDVWGNINSDTNPGFQPFGFAGGVHDHHSGFVRFGARDYDPGTGRWTTKDPVKFNGGDTNLYGYVLNDPVNLVDPEGQAPVVPIVTAAVGAIVGGISGGIHAADSGSNVFTGVARGLVVGGTTGLFGGAGYGSVRASLSLRLDGSRWSSMISSTFGSLIGNTLAGIDIVSQAQAAACD